MQNNDVLLIDRLILVLGLGLVLIVAAMIGTLPKREERKSCVELCALSGKVMARETLDPRGSRLDVIVYLSPGR